MAPVMVATYLAAAVAANLAVASFGQKALLVTGFLLIPFDLTARDLLHDRWHSGPATRLLLRMAALVLAGSALTYLTNRSAASVAIASAFAFLLAGITDTLVYFLLDDFSQQTRMNTSNICSALVDSIVFPLIAFSDVNAVLCLSQWGVKVAGGLLWVRVVVMVIEHRQKKESERFWSGRWE